MSQSMIFKTVGPMLPLQETTRKACAVNATMLGGHSLGQKQKPNTLHPYLTVTVHWESLIKLGQGTV